MSILNNQETQSRSHIKDPVIMKSPNLPRKQSNVSNKEFLNEVEEKLKAMRLKRLSRLNAFVDEQSKLSEERNKENHDQEVKVDQAKASIQKEIVKPKPSFKAIAEEVINDTANNSKSEIIENKQNLRNKTSSTIKFFNKISCVSVADMRSSVDYHLRESDSLFIPRNNIVEKKQENPEEVNKKQVKLKAVPFHRNTINFPDDFSVELKYKTDKINHCNTLPSTKSHPSLLSTSNEPKDEENTIKDKIEAEDFITPVYKTNVRRNSLGDLLINSTAENIENNNERIVKSPMSTFGKSTPNLLKIFSDPILQSQTDKIDRTKYRENTKTRESDVCKREENVNVGKIEETTHKEITKTSEIVEAKRKENTIEITENKHKENIKAVATETTELKETTKVGEIDQNKSIENVKAKLKEKTRIVEIDENERKEIITAGLTKLKVDKINETKHTENINVPQIKREPSPLSVISTKTNKEEKILKRLQRNWVTINEIFDNDSEVDSDEMSDFKNTASDVRDFLSEYERKVKKLEHKMKSTLRYNEDLNIITQKLEETANAINKFRGFRKDDLFTDILNRLLSYVAEVENIPGLLEEKSMVLRSIENCGKMLVEKTHRHEVMLQELLKEQVDIIGRRHLPIFV